MNKKWLYPLLVIAFLFAVGPASAQIDGSVEAELAVPEGPLAVGDPIELTLSVTHPSGYLVILPELVGQWGDFIVQSQSTPQTIDVGNGQQVTSQVIDARLFAPGTFVTPSVVISFTDGNGRVDEVLARPAEVTIGSVLVEGDTELRDIKPQATLPYTNLLPWIALGLLLVAGGLGLAFILRQRQRRLALAAIDNRLPHEVALDELAHIQSLNLPEQGRFKEHYSLISDCVRLYMEKRFEIPMMERTTAEIAANLEPIEANANISGQYLSLLDVSDLVKFSKFKPEIASAYGLLASARQIVIATQQAEEPGDESNGPRANTKIKTTAGPDPSSNGGYRHTEVRA